MSEYFDILVIVPLEEELVSILEVFRVKENRTSNSVFKAVVETEVPNLKMLVSLQEQMGKSAALRSTQSLLQEYQAGLVVCLGIAGSLSTDARLGDVCYSEEIIDVLDNTKAFDRDGEVARWSCRQAISPRQKIFPRR